MEQEETEYFQDAVFWMWDPVPDSYFSAICLELIFVISGDFIQKIYKKDEMQPAENNSFT